MADISCDDIIKEYFLSWLKKDISAMEKHFWDDIFYSECYGPEYQNKEQCLKWFNEWNKKGRVLEWSIKTISKAGQKYFVEWYFLSDFEGNVEGFDGVSIITFQNRKIVCVKEFQSISEHYCPYQGV